SQVQEGSAEHPRALRAARQAFPFLEPLTRWSWRCRTPETSSSTDNDGETGTGDVKEDDTKGGREGSGRRKRGRDNTGVASLLVALAKADPSGETIKSMMRWAIEGLMPEQVAEAPWSAAGTLADRNEVARCLMSTREMFSDCRDARHLSWMRA
ncbi:unnamed protein product, partial [Ectocarpus sp. 8 AP-2014]